MSQILIESRKKLSLLESFTCPCLLLIGYYFNWLFLAIGTLFPLRCYQIECSCVWLLVDACERCMGTDGRVPVECLIPYSTLFKYYQYMLCSNTTYLRKQLLPANQTPSKGKAPPSAPRCDCPSFPAYAKSQISKARQLQQCSPEVSGHHSPHLLLFFPSHLVLLLTVISSIALNSKQIVLSINLLQPCLTLLLTSSSSTALPVIVSFLPLVVSTVTLAVPSLQALPGHGDSIDSIANPSFYHLAQQGRIDFKLYDPEVPRTAKNFATLCQNHPDPARPGEPFGYKGSTFHRVIPQFMLQGGDFTRHNVSKSKPLFPVCFFGQACIRKGIRLTKCFFLIGHRWKVHLRREVC